METALAVLAFDLFYSFIIQPDQYQVKDHIKQNIYHGSHCCLNRSGEDRIVGQGENFFTERVLYVIDTKEISNKAIM